MRNPSAMASSTVPEPASFDPFGEPVTAALARECPSSSTDRTARRIGGLVFWSLALLILAGRIYTSDIPVTQAVMSAVTQIASLR